MVCKAAKLTAAAFILTGALALSACTTAAPEAEDYTPPGVTYEEYQPETEPDNNQAEDYIPTYDGNHIPDEELAPLDGTNLELLRENPAIMLQLTPLTSGEELAILHTNMGDITLRFFPEEAPMAVENFKTHARNGFYDGVIFHRVIPNFMIQGGCPLGQGNAGESIWGGTFHTETSFNLRHFNGAVAMAHAGPGTIGSQFYIVHNHTLAPQHRMEFEHLRDIIDMPIGIFEDGTRFYVRDLHPEDGLNYFIENGGTHHLDWFWNEHGPHPVFAHVVDGMDVVNAIATTETAPGDRPIEDMIIESISFVIYE